MSDLTLEEQKLLTEFLGETWDDCEHYTAPYNSYCPRCGTHFKHWHRRLDFTDGRVVMRLIEKVGGMVFVGRLVDMYGYNDEGILGICCAIAAYLKEQKDDNPI